MYVCAYAMYVVCTVGSYVRMLRTHVRVFMAMYVSMYICTYVVLMHVRMYARFVAISSNLHVFRFNSICCSRRLGQFHFG